MPNSSLASQVVALGDSNGNLIEFTLTPGPSGSGADSGISIQSGSTVAALIISTNGAAQIGASTSNGSCTVACDAGGTGAVSILAENFLSVVGEIVVGPNSVVASTNNGSSGETSVQNDLAYLNTLNAQGAPNSNYTRQSANHVGRYSGIGQFTDALGSSNAVNCDIPFGVFPPAANHVITAWVEIYVLAKCIVTSAGGTPVVGDYHLFKGYSTWINVNGTITPTNQFISGTTPVTLPILNVTDERASTAILIPGPGSFVALPLAMGVAAVGSNIQVQARPPLSPPGAWGTSTVEIYCTVYFN